MLKIVVALLFVFTVVSALTGEVKSCSGWKLNHLPEVKRFLKTAGHVDAYENVKITWIPGHKPTLYLKDDQGVPFDQIDLSGYTTEQLHQLFVEKGFERKAVGTVPGAIDARGL